MPAIALEAHNFDSACRALTLLSARRVNNGASTQVHTLCNSKLPNTLSCSAGMLWWMLIWNHVALTEVDTWLQEELMNVCPLEAISSENAKNSAAAILKVCA